MFASSMYHLYRDIGPKESQMFLKYDLIGIVLMIFVFAFVAVWLAFSPHPRERFYIFGILLGIFCTNLLLSVTPCYTDEKYEPMRIAFNVFIILSLFSLAVTWYLYFGTAEEIELFFGPLMLSYVMLLLGFIFYSSHFPECFFTEEKFGPRIAYFVQIYLQSHIWWHVFVSANAYILYDLCFKAIIFYNLTK